MTVNLAAPPNLIPLAGNVTAYAEDLLASLATTTQHIACESGTALPVTDRWVVAGPNGGRLV